MATLWRDKLHETFYSVTYPARAKFVARQVSRAVAESRIKFYFSCNLSCNDFGHRRVWYTVKCFAQLVLSQCRQNIARQVVQNISQCNSALRLQEIGKSLFSSPLQPDFNNFGDLKLEKRLTRPQTQPNIFLCMQDHADEGTIGKYQIRTRKVASKGLNIKGVSNPVCCHGNKTGMLILWSTSTRILLQGINPF